MVFHSYFFSFFQELTTCRKMIFLLRKIFGFLLLCSKLKAACCGASTDRDFYSYTVKDINGQDYNLEKLRGTVTLVVNVASICGFTDAHYKGLTKMQESLGQDGVFQVLAFPCNQFGKQEPGRPEEIMKFAHENYAVNFDIMKKIDVIGDHAEPAFRNLIEQSGKTPDWNFWKYLVGPDGRVVNAWGPRYRVDVIFDDVMRAVTKAGGDVKSTLGDKGFNPDEL